VGLSPANITNPMLEYFDEYDDSTLATVISPLLEEVRGYFA
jgi:hypothetical protein